MTKLIDLKTKMSAEMFAELHHRVVSEPALFEVEICAVSKDGYLRNSKYVGALSSGERIHRIDTEYGVMYVRSSATASQLRAAFKNG